MMTAGPVNKLDNKPTGPKMRTDGRPRPSPEQERRWYKNTVARRRVWEVKLDALITGLVRLNSRGAYQCGMAPFSTLQRDVCESVQLFGVQVPYDQASLSLSIKRIGWPMRGVRGPREGAVFRAPQMVVVVFDEELAGWALDKSVSGPTVYKAANEAVAHASNAPPPAVPDLL